MELQEFIKSTIIQISKGIKEAQKELADSAVIINPSRMKNDSKGNKFLDKSGFRFVQDIEINVGIVATEKDGKKAGIGVFSGFLSGGVQASENNSNQSINNIKFTIPVALPCDETPKENDHSVKVF